MIKGNCSKCGTTSLATLDDGVLTWLDVRPDKSRRGSGGWGEHGQSFAIDDPSFVSASIQGDVAVHCPNPKCRHRYAMADVVQVLKVAQRRGKRSVKLPTIPH